MVTNDRAEHGKIYRCLEYSFDQNGELYLIACGHETRNPHIITGPNIRNGYHLHVILSGKGTLVAGGKEFHPHGGQMFLLKDGESFTYYSEEDPWEYCWLTFNGDQAVDTIRDMGFTEGVYVVDLAIDPREFFGIIYQMHQKPEVTYFNEMRRKGLMYEFLALALEATSTEDLIKTKRDERPIDSYVEMAKDFIHHNYNSITVNEISEYIGFTRSYFTTVFKEHTGQSPQQYLKEYRLVRACQQLNQTSLPIQEIAKSVGYDNALTFSRMFKNELGISPTEYREKKGVE